MMGFEFLMVLNLSGWIVFYVFSKRLLSLLASYRCLLWVVLYFVICLLVSLLGAGLLCLFVFVSCGCELYTGFYVCLLFVFLGIGCFWLR